MRVLIAINGLGTGGAERSLATSLPRLVAGGVEPVIACLFRRSEGVQARLEAEGHRIHFLKSTGRLSRIAEMRQLVRAERPDLVHTTLFESDVTGRIAARGGPPVLSSLVSVPYEPIRLTDPAIRRSRLRAVQAIDGWTARNMTDHFHAVTQAVKDASVEALRISPDKVTVVPRGRDPEQLGRTTRERRATTRQLLGIGIDAPLLASVGRQEFAKGQRLLLEAVAPLLLDYPNLVVVVAGRKGNASGELEALHDRFGFGDRVRFLGHRDDVADIVAAADIFVFPSLYEGIGGSLIEAMALERPIVTTDVPSIVEVVERDRNALVVPRGDSAALTSAVRTLLDDRDLRARFGARGRDIFLDRFSLDRSVDGMIGLYQRVIGSRGPLVHKGTRELPGRASPG